MKGIVAAITALVLTSCASMDYSAKARPYPDVPRTTADFLAKGRYFMTRKNGERRALESFQLALIAATDNAEKAQAHIALGDLFFRMRRDKEAGPEYVKALKLDPDNAHARTRLGATLMFLKQFAAAREQLDMVIEKYPAYAEAYAWRGLVSGKQKLWEKAIPDYQRALMYELPKMLKIRVYAEIANAYFITGNYNLALDTWTEMIEMEPRLNTRKVRKYMAIARAAQKEKIGS